MTTTKRIKVGTIVTFSADYCQLFEAPVGLSKQLYEVTDARFAGPVSVLTVRPLDAHGQPDWDSSGRQCFADDLVFYQD